VAYDEGASLHAECAGGLQIAVHPPTPASQGMGHLGDGVGRQWQVDFFSFDWVGEGSWGDCSSQDGALADLVVLVAFEVDVQLVGQVVQRRWMACFVPP